MSLRAISAAECPISLGNFDELPITFVVPPSSGDAWYDAYISITCSVSGSSDFYVTRVYSLDELQMYMTSIGERVGNELYAGNYSNVSFSSWNGFDSTIHSMFGIKGQLWEQLVALKVSGGTFSTNVKFYARDNIGNNNDYYLENFITDPTANIYITDIKLNILYGTAADAPNPLVTRLCQRHSAARYKDIAISVAHHSYSGYEYSEGTWLQVNVIDLTTLASGITGTKYLDKYFIEVNKPHYESGLGVLSISNGKFFIAYNDHNMNKVYLYNDRFGLGGTTGSTTFLPTGVIAPIPIDYKNGWTDAGDLGWPSTNILDQCNVNGLTYALFGYVDKGTIFLDACSIGDSGEVLTTTNVCTGATIGALELQTDHYIWSGGSGGAGIEFSDPFMIVLRRGSNGQVWRTLFNPFNTVSGGERIIGSTSNTTCGNLKKALPSGILAKSGASWISFDRGITFENTGSTTTGICFSVGEKIINLVKPTYNQPSGPQPRPSTYTVSVTEDYGRSVLFYTI